MPGYSIIKTVMEAVGTVPFVKADFDVRIRDRAPIKLADLSEIFCFIKRTSLIGNRPLKSEV